MTREETWQRLIEIGAVEGDMPEERFNLGGADLRGADLTGANLREANLLEADLTGADLTGADLVGADLRGTDLCDCALDGAKISFRGRIVRIRLEDENNNKE